MSEFPMSWCRWTIVLLVVCFFVPIALIIAVASLRDDGESNQERTDRLYSECLDAGGSFTYDGGEVTFSCDVPVP